MANYSKVSISDEPRTEFHDQLGLTGAEISVNNFLPELMFHSSIPTRKMKKYTLSFQVRVK